MKCERSSEDGMNEQTNLVEMRTRVIVLIARIYALFGVASEHAGTFLRFEIWFSEKD